MEISVLPFESQLLGGNVLKLEGWDSAGEIIAAEREIIRQHSPKYIFCEVHATELSTIHRIESIGYLFSEFRIKSILNTDNSDTGTRGYYPYLSKIIGENDHLEAAIRMLQSTDDDDRFSNDPMIGKVLSKERIINNLRKSFHSYPDEFILGVFNSHTDELIAFRSVALISHTEAHYYLYGVAAGIDFNHTASMLEAFTIEYLKKNGIRMIHAVSTGYNIAELNRLIKNHNFKIVSSHILMRKVFLR